jgi:DNA-binding MarR family transcriptional regulator
MTLNRNPFEHAGTPVLLFLHLYKSSLVMTRGLEQHLAEHRLTLGKLCVLVSLRQSDGSKLPSEIGDDLAVTRANVSGLLRSLEGMGLVSRETDLDDRRRTLVTLTPEGARVLDQVWPTYEGAITGAMSTLSAEEQRLLLGLLRKLGGPL